MNLFVLIVFGVVTGLLAAAGRLLVDMIFWGSLAVDIQALISDAVCGATLGAIFMALLALLRDVFRSPE